MSLAQSVFGDAVSKTAEKKSDLTALFEKKSTPEPSSNQAKSTVKRKRDDNDEGSESGSSSSSSSAGSNDKGEQEASAATGPDNNSADSKDPAAEKQNETKGGDLKPKDPDEEERTIFVGNLPLSTTRRSLAKLFKDCGKIQSTRLRSVAVAGVKLPQNRAGDQNLVKKVCTHTQQFDVQAKSSLQGYVVFADKESVPKALELNNSPVPDESPNATRAIRRIRVDQASPTFDPSRSVFVGNLPYGADEGTLQDCFVHGCSLQIKDVESVRVIRDPETFQCKGFGYVQFRERNMVATALQKMHEQVYMKRPLRVKVCGKSIKGRRGGTNNKKQKTESGGDSHSNHSGRPSLEGQRAKAETTSGGVMERLAKKQKKKRARGEKKKPGDMSKTKPGVSKRAATESKVNKRVKKLQKRISKGMGKARSK